jgi:hypothetical protein
VFVLARKRRKIVLFTLFPKSEGKYEGEGKLALEKDLDIEKFYIHFYFGKNG